MSCFSTLINALANELGITADTEENHVALVLDEHLYDMYYDPDTEKLLAIAMVADLGEAPTAQQQTLIFKQLMKAQFCFVESTGFTFALSDNEEFIALQALWDIANMTEQTFIANVEKFTQTTNLWSNKLQANAQATTTQDASFNPLEHFGYIQG